MSAFGGYSSTAVGGDDGGGFMWGSQGGSQSASKPINDESLRPVTIKQIIDAEPAYAGDASFRIDGLDVKQVTVVGMVRAINPQTTNITYKLDDGTGVVEVKQWLDADRAGDAGAGGGGGGSGALPTFDVGAYVRVWGRLKSFSNKRHIGAHVIKPVRDFNEVNYHLLEATYVHLFFTRGPLKPSSVPGGVGAGVGIGVGAGGHSDSMFVDDGGAGYRGSSSKAKTMYNYLQRSGNPTEGIHMQVIARATGMTVQDIMVAAEELLSHGTIYTTMDDETYAILDR